jgi:hypothetical protein
MALTYAQLEKLKEELMKIPAPPRDNQTPNKQEAVAFIADAIAEMQAREFTLEQIAHTLSGKGFDITTPTLKSYLSRINAKKSRRKTGSRTKKGAASSVHKDAPTKAVEKAKDAPVKHAPEGPKKDPQAAFLSTDKAKY